MRVASAAIGLAAVGAGLLVARMWRGRHGEDETPVPAAAPPEPDQLIGAPRSRKSARDSAEVLERRDRPM